VVEVADAKSRRKRSKIGSQKAEKLFFSTALEDFRRVANFRPIAQRGGIPSLKACV